MVTTKAIQEVKFEFPSYFKNGNKYYALMDSETFVTMYNGERYKVIQREYTFPHDIQYEFDNLQKIDEVEFIEVMSAAVQYLSNPFY